MFDFYKNFLYNCDMRKKICISLICLIYLMTTVFAFGCAKKVYSADFYAFTVPIHIEVYDSKITDSEKEKISNLLSDFEKIFSFQQDGDTKKVNNANANETICVTEEFYTLFNKAKYCHDLSSGNYDPTVFPLVTLWGFYPNYPIDNFTVPTEDAIKTALDSVGLNKVALSYENGNYYAVKNDSATSLDFGGSAKGYAADCIAEILISNGHNTGYVNVGTSSLNLLSVDSLEVRNPNENASSNLLRINCKNMNNISVSTSGTYERFYVKDGTTYSHIINPFNGYPTTSKVESVTILGKDGVLADCMTTALCVIPHDFNSPTDAKKSGLVALVKKMLATDEFKDSLIFIATNNGEKKQLITNANSIVFTLLDSSYTVYYI